MEHSDFSSDISSDDIDDEFEHHEHEQKSEYLKIEMITFKYGMH